MKNMPAEYHLQFVTSICKDVHLIHDATYFFATFSSQIPVVLGSKSVRLSKYVRGGPIFAFGKLL